jgi:hypothetical protein
MSRVARLRAWTVRWSRDLVALAGVGCIAIGLATVSVALAWIVAGAFLVFASGSGRRRAA